MQKSNNVYTLPRQLVGMQVDAEKAIVGIHYQGSGQVDAEKAFLHIHYLGSGQVNAEKAIIGIHYQGSGQVDAEKVIIGTQEMCGFLLRHSFIRWLNDH